MRIARLRLPDSPPAFAELVGDEAAILDRAPWYGGTRTGRLVTFTERDLLAPVEPTKILCVGRNYAAHAKELGHELPSEPLLFFKPPSAIVGPGDDVHMPAVSERVDHEAELALVIGRVAKNLTRANALAHLAGFTAANDVTARDLQKRDGQWARAKGFDTFCPVGPWIETECSRDRLRTLRVRAVVDGVERQNGLTEHMIFDVESVLVYASAIFTLEPGDLILTGTPEGVAPLDHGAACTVSIEEATGTTLLALENRFVRS